jgi:hypothetical protein
MRNNKSIEGFMDACLEIASRMGLQRSELDKLLPVLVVTRADLSARSSLRNIPIPFPIPAPSQSSDAGEGVFV